MWHLEVLYTKAHSNNKYMKIPSTFCPLEPSAGKCQWRTAQLKHDLQFFLNERDIDVAKYWCLQKDAVKEHFHLLYNINLCANSVPTNEVIIYKWV